MKSYENLKREVEEISTLVAKLPVNLQEKAFDALLDAYKGGSEDIVTGSKAELNQIAQLSESGNFKFLLRDPKAKNAKDAAKRIIYILIRSYNILTNESGVSRKDILNPVLNEWNLNTGNTRGFITNDKGIVKKGDLLNLDKVAEKEADKFIAQINDESYLGKWQR